MVLGTLRSVNSHVGMGMHRIGVYRAVADITAVKTRIIGQRARTLDLPLLVRSVFFYFFFVPGGMFFGVFFPLSIGGNFGRRSTPSNYSSFYGSKGASYHCLVCTFLKSCTWPSQPSSREKRVMDHDSTSRYLLPIRKSKSLSSIITEGVK